MSTAASDSASAETIVLIHGMWMTPLSWEHYASHYIDRGHRVIAPAWPGLDKEPAELRRDPSPLRGISMCSSCADAANSAPVFRAAMTR